MTAELEYLNEENGRLRRAVETYKAELALRIAEVDSLNIDKGHMREQMNADRKQALVWRDEAERLKAQLAQANGMTAAWKLTHDAVLASGAVQKEPIQDVAMHVLTSIGGIDYDTAKSLIENAYGAAHTSKTIDVKWHHDLAPAPKPPSSFEAEAALVAQRKAFMGSR